MDDNLLLKDASMVYDLLREEFGSDKWRKAHEDSYKISVMNIDYMDEQEVDDAGARKMAHSFDVTRIGAHGRGARDLFSFEAVHSNCLQSRVFSCWCMGCVLSGSTRYTAGDVPAAIRTCLPANTQLAQEWGQCEQAMACAEWESQGMHEIAEVCVNRSTMRTVLICVYTFMCVGRCRSEQKEDQRAGGGHLQCGANELSVCC
jgi:hypothetical protein